MREFDERLAYCEANSKFLTDTEQADLDVVLAAIANGALRPTTEHITTVANLAPRIAERRRRVKEWLLW